MYTRDRGGLKQRSVVSVGDPQGKPNMGKLWKVNSFKIWKSNMTQNGWGGPCIWRPMDGGCNRPGEMTYVDCFDHFAPDGTLVSKSGTSKDVKKICETEDVSFAENRIQHYGKEQTRVAKQTCVHELSFALTYLYLLTSVILWHVCQRFCWL